MRDAGSPFRPALPVRPRGSRRRRAAAWALAVGVLLAHVAGARGGPEPSGPALTALAAGPLGRSTHVALGEVLDQRDVHDVQLVRVKVERWLKGLAQGSEINVLVGGPAPTADRQRPSAPYFDGRAGGSYLLFLVQRASGGAFALENRIPVSGLEAAEKIAAVESQIGLAAIADPGERARRVLAHFLEALTAPGAWTRANAARELNYLGGVRPGVFAARARARLERVAEAPATAPAVRTWLRNLLTQLGPSLEGAPSEVPPEPPSPAEGASRSDGPAPQPLSTEERIRALDAALTRSGADAERRALLLLRDATEPEVRVWLVDWLGESGHDAALPDLRAAYVREEQPAVREAIVRAAGLLGTDADVPWLLERLANTRLVEAALVALARVRSPAARAALNAYRTRCLAGNEEERDLAARIERLLSPAFEEGERMGGHRLGPERGAEKQPESAPR